VPCPTKPHQTIRKTPSVAILEDDVLVVFGPKYVGRASVPVPSPVLLVIAVRLCFLLLQLCVRSRVVPLLLVGDLVAISGLLDYGGH
jgi:hypothetical protein